MGVSALAESSIKIVLNQWPDAEVTLLGTGAAKNSQTLTISGREVHLKLLGLRFGKNIFKSSHFCVLLLNALLLKLIPLKKFGKMLSAINPQVKVLLEADKVFDITGGDSFSDIYGMRRFLIYGFLQKWLVTLFGKELILLPQTFGPFNRSIARRMARCVLKRSSVAYARDRSSEETLGELLKGHAVNGKIRFSPDVAFVLDPREPRNIDIGSLTEVRKKDSVVVGLNVSGLLFNGGYTQGNMFGLKTDYRELVFSIIDFFMKDKKVLIILVPHVFASEGSVESDPDACLKIYEEMKDKYPGRIFPARGEYNHNEIKYIIGLCDFFVGSRMHACIAALSQFVPAVGLAYSKKFKGVFESIGIENYVADAYVCKSEEVLSIIKAAYNVRSEIRAHLEKVIPQMQKDILNMFATGNIPRVIDPVTQSV
jgi:polysaccharide pyruvyl transferase WcaK-like protein